MRGAERYDGIFYDGNRIHSLGPNSVALQILRGQIAALEEILSAGASGRTSLPAISQDNRDRRMSEWIRDEGAFPGRKLRERRLLERPLKVEVARGRRLSTGSSR